MDDLVPGVLYAPPLKLTAGLRPDQRQNEIMAYALAAHEQKITHHYTLLYPEHPAREDDPHYKDFNAYRRRTRATAKCAIGEHRNDFSECSDPSKWPVGLELHHSHIEFSLQQGIDLGWLEVDYPGVSDPNTVGAWVESAANLTWLCERHHRGIDGVHVLSASDQEAIKYVRGLVGE